MAATVTVVITTYNSEPFLRECLASVAAQTYQDLEIVVADDASTDDTVAAAEASRGGRPLRAVRNEKNHGGPSRPRNLGVAAAAGRYVTFLDADDRLAPHCVADAVAFLQHRPDVGLVFFNPLVVPVGATEQGRPVLEEFEQFRALPREPVGDGGEVIGSAAAFPYLIRANFIRTTGLTMPRAVYDAVGPFDEDLTNADDWDLWLRVARRYPLGFIDRPSGWVQKREGSITTRGGRLARNWIRVLDKLLISGVTGLALRNVRHVLAASYCTLGYVHQSAGEASMARSCYRRSWREEPSWFALKGWVLSLPGDRWLRFLRRARLRSIGRAGAGG